jgi:hypothetical protein
LLFLKKYLKKKIIIINITPTKINITKTSSSSKIIIFQQHKNHGTTTINCAQTISISCFTPTATTTKIHHSTNTQIHPKNCGGR